MRAPWTAAVLAALALGGCGDDGDDRDAGESPSERDGPIELKWMRAQTTAGGDVVRLGYVNDPCTRARQARVESGDTSVTITLLDPERDPAEVCVALAKPGCAEVPLAEPLAGRRLVDGARARLPPEEGGDAPFSRFEPCRRVPVVE